MRPCSDVVDNNQSNTSFYIYSSIYFFDDIVTLHIFFLLRVIWNSSSQPRRVLEFRVNTSWPWHPGASLLSGPKCSSYHLCLLKGQIGWHALTLNRVLALCVCKSTFASTVSMVLRPRLLVDIPCLAGSCGRPRRWQLRWSSVVHLPLAGLVGFIGLWISILCGVFLSRGSS